jgi:hypothetical protein
MLGEWPTQEYDESSGSQSAKLKGPNEFFSTFDFILHGVVRQIVANLILQKSLFYFNRCNHCCQIGMCR